MSDSVWCTKCGTEYPEGHPGKCSAEGCDNDVMSVIKPPIARTAEDDAEEPAIEQAEAEIVDPVQEARSLVPVGHGAEPDNLAGQVQFARDMCKADIGVPPHLRGPSKVGACVAVIDIAQRANLSPYMVANLSYVTGEGPKQRLGFMSQLWHALLEQSKRLDGVLKHKFDGEGEEMTCTVYGCLRGDPDVLMWVSPPLAQVRPKKNEYGATKGSPLWDRKPRVQLLYDTQRDWVRIYCPAAVAGIPIDDEPPPNAAPEPTLVERLAAADRSKGHQNGHAERELATIGARATEIMPAKPRRAAGTRQKAKVARGTKVRAAKRISAVARAKQPRVAQ